MPQRRQPTANRPGKAGIFRKNLQDASKPSLTFVNALPTSAAESARTRSLVRANATKYQWRNSKSSAHRPGAQEIESEELEEDVSLSEQSADLATSPLRPLDPGRETSSDSTEEPVRSSWPRKIFLSRDDRGEKPWLGLAFPTEWNSDPVPSQWMKADEFPNPNWGPTTMLGADKTDPFKVYPSVLTRESVARLIGLNINTIFPRLLPSASDKFNNPAAVWWLPRMMSSKALFHAFMYGAAVYSQVQAGNSSFQGSRETQIAYSEAIHELNGEMLDSERACADENMLAVAIMGYNSMGMAPVRTGKLPNQAPLKGLQSLDVYGLLSMVPMHAVGLVKIIEMKGGLKSIKMEGLAATLSFAGIANATHTLTQPPFPFVPILQDSLPVIPRSPSPENTSYHSLSSLGKGFWILSRACPLTVDLMNALECMVDYTIIVNDYAQGRPMHVSITAIIDQKNATQFALMSLPAASAHLPDPRIVEPMYEACRLAAIIYSIIVVLPWPASTAPFHELASQLKEELTGGDFMKGSPRAPELLLWILFMGGIASISLAGRTWYVESIGFLAKKMNLESREKIKEIMTNFLWLESTSDGDGMELWNDVLLFNREKDERKNALLTGSLPLF